MSTSRLRALFGCDFGEITETHLDALAQRSVPEDQDLDFKGDHYEKSSSGAFEIGKDIAALANHIGGRIIIGIAENSQGQAEALAPVALDDAEIRRIESLVTGIHPMVTGVRIRSIASATDDSRGFYVIDVPRSPMAPHGLWRDRNDKTWLCFPVRHGTTTYYMTENQLASKYRDRFTWAREQVDRLEQLHLTGNRPPKSTAQAAVAVAVVPAVPGERALNGSAPTIATFVGEVWKPLHIVAIDPKWGRISVARRRLRSVGSRLTVELHTDGSGWARVLVGQASLPDMCLIRLEEVEAVVVELLALLGAYAVWAGAGGDAAVGVWLYDGPPKNRIAETEAYIVLPLTPAETTTPVDQLAEEPGRAAYPLLLDLVQDMNLLEPINLRPDGTLKNQSG